MHSEKGKMAPTWHQGPKTSNNLLDFKGFQNDPYLGKVALYH